MKPLLTIIYAYYDNPQMFIRQQEEWMRYPFEVSGRVQFIIVDDCSPRWPARLNYHFEGWTDFRIYRMKQDIPWNMDACRNLAVSKATAKWLFLSDMDHLLSVEAIVQIFKYMGRLDIEKFYTFNRVDAPDLKPYKYHPNTYLMTKELYNKVGGYDETFAGHYGTDGHFRRALLHHSKGVQRLPISIIRYPREVIPDASTTTLDRKKGRDRERGRRYRELSKQNLQKGIKPKILSFPWERIL
jgi:predicted glycosyltransferase involved in capsule biosynthesis